MYNWLKNNKKNIMISLCLLVVVFGCLVVMFQPVEFRHQRVENGQVIINDFGLQNIYEFEGEWQCFPGELLSPQDIEQEENIPSRYFYLPGNMAFEGYDKVTYRLKVQIIGDQREIKRYAIKFDRLKANTRIFINGYEASNELLAGDINQFAQFVHPMPMFFRNDKSDVEIVVQCAKQKDESLAGVIQPVRFGSEIIIGNSYERDLWASVIQGSCYCLSLLIFLGLFFRRSDQQELIWFAAFAMANFAWYSFNSNEGVILLKEHRLLFQKVYYVLYLLIDLCFLRYIAIIVDYRQARALKMIQGVSLVIAILIALLPIPCFFIVEEAVLIWCAVLVTIALYWASSDKQRYYVLFGAICWWIATMTNLGYWRGWLSNREIIWILMLIFLTVQIINIVDTYVTRWLNEKNIASYLRKVEQMQMMGLSKAINELLQPVAAMERLIERVYNYQAGKATEVKSLLSAIADNCQRTLQKIHLLSSISREQAILSQLNAENIDVRQMLLLTADIRQLSRDNPTSMFNVANYSQIIIADREKCRQLFINLLAVCEDIGRTWQITVNDNEDNVAIIFNSSDVFLGSILIKDIIRIVEQTGTREYTADESVGQHWRWLIIKTLINMLKGNLNLTIENTIAKLQVSLPRGKSRASMVKDELTNEAISDAVASGEAVAVVSSSPAMRKLAEKSLTAFGLYCEYINSGEALIEKLKLGQTYQFYLIDLQLPDMSGLEAVQELRRVHSLLEGPAALLYSEEYPDVVRAAQRAGANACCLCNELSGELALAIDNLQALHRAYGEAVDNELKYLRSQINPHFVHNTLESINALIDFDSVRAQQLLGNFSQYLRCHYTFNERSKEINLAEELELVYAYVEIEKARMDDRLEVVIDVAEGVERALVPALIIQPLLENAIKHGIFPNPQGGKVIINIYRHDDRLFIEIKDNGVGLAVQNVAELMDYLHKGKRKSGIGVRNVLRRIDRYFDAQLQVTGQVGLGLSYVIDLPYRQGENR